MISSGALLPICPKKYIPVACIPNRKNRGQASQPGHTRELLWPDEHREGHGHHDAGKGGPCKAHVAQSRPGTGNCHGNTRDVAHQRRPEERLVVQFPAKIGVGHRTEGYEEEVERLHPDDAGNARLAIEVGDPAAGGKQACRHQPGDDDVGCERGAQLLDRQLLFLDQVLAYAEIAQRAGNRREDRGDAPHARLGGRQQPRQEERGNELQSDA